LVAEPLALAGDEEPNPCVLCRSARASPLFDVDGSVVVRCHSCGLVRQAMRPRAANGLYDSRYYAVDDPKGGYANYFLDAEINALTFRGRARAIGIRTGRRGRLLDVGSALGDFLIAASHAGWRAEGVEISSYAAAHARKRGATVHLGTLESLALPARSYEVVTLYDTIEHLQDPAAALREARRLLVPGGLIHIVTPNVAGIQARVLGRRWYHYKPGEHLYYFAPPTLRRLVEAAGLTWLGWERAASYLAVAYVFNRLRYQAPRLFGTLERASRRLVFGTRPFYAYVGEMSAWARA